jgi:Lysozyme like domain
MQALIAEHIDPLTLGTDQFYALVMQLWQDQRLQDEFGLYNGDTSLGNVDVSVSAAQVRDAIQAELFSPTQSGDHGLLQSGLTLRQQQGLPLSTPQSDFLATGTTGSSSSGYLADLARRAGFPEDQIATAVAVAMAESGGNPDAVGDLSITPGGSIGLWQINLQAHPDLAAKFDLKDPLQNAMAAYQVWQNSGGRWSPWTTYNTGAYQQYLGAGQGPYVRGGAVTTANSLDTQYAGIVSTFNSYAGRKPTPQELMGLIGMTPDELTQYMRSWNSHIPGLTVGGYEDMRAAADKESNAMFGHGVTDGMIGELNKEGMTSPTAIRFWLMQQDIAGKMDPKTYQQLYKANQPHMAGIYSQPYAFDPRIAAQQHEKAVAQGALARNETVNLERQWADFRKQQRDFGDPDISAQQRDIAKTEADTAAGVF